MSSRTYVPVLGTNEEETGKPDSGSEAADENLGVLCKEENGVESTSLLLHVTNLEQYKRITEGEDTSADNVGAGWILLFDLSPRS